MAPLITADATDVKTGEKVTVQYETDCTVVFNGKAYSSGGASITPKTAVAYFSNKPKQAPAITTWHGEILSTDVNILNRIRWHGWQSSERLYVRFKIGNIVYSGATFGDGMVIQGKATKRSTV